MQDQLKERSQTLQNSNPKYSKNQCKIVPKSTPKSIFFWTPFGDAWRPRFWAGFGVDLGSIWGPFWGQKNGLKAIGKMIKNMIGKKSRPGPRDLRATGLWSPKRNQSDWLPADLLRPRNTPLVPRGTVADLQSQTFSRVESER